MPASPSGCHVCGSVMGDEDLHRRWHGLTEDDWAAQKKAANAESDARIKEAMAKAEVTKPDTAPPAPAPTPAPATTSAPGTATA